MITPEDEIARLRTLLEAANLQLNANKAIEDGDIPAACSWLQQKADRQGKALDRLQSRVVGQRFQLRTLNEMGRGLTREEYLAAKAQVAEPQQLKRLEAVEPQLAPVG